MNHDCAKTEATYLALIDLLDVKTRELETMTRERDEACNSYTQIKHDNVRLEAEGMKLIDEQMLRAECAEKALAKSELQLSEARSIICAMLKHEDEGVYLCDDIPSCKCATCSARRFVSATHPQGVENRLDAQAKPEDACCPCGCHRSTSECCGCPGTR